MTVGPAVGLELKNMFSMRGDFIGGLLLASICIVASRFISYEEKLKTRKPGEKIKISLFEKTSLLPASMIFTATVAQTSLTAYLALYGLSLIHIFLFVGGFPCKSSGKRPFVVPLPPLCVLPALVGEEEVGPRKGKDVPCFPSCLPRREASLRFGFLHYDQLRPKAGPLHAEKGG